MGSKTDDLLLLRVTDTDHNLRASRNGLDGEVDQCALLRIAERVELAETAEEEQSVQSRLDEMIDVPLHVFIVDCAVILQYRNDG